jgi:hypothetical protein
MSGELHFMSVDLARYIASDECPRNRVTIPTQEDGSISNYVFSHPESVNVVRIPASKTLITRELDAEWNKVDLKQNPEGYLRFLWGHSPRKERFEYFKSLRSMQKMWRKARKFWRENNELV